jgi:acyl-coenzyme A synthetase/AMP-(fatty) acid ligase
MNLDYETLWSSWNPWAAIPRQYNLGVDLTTGQVRKGLGDKVALHWENADGAMRRVTYRELDGLSTRLARSLHRMGVASEDLAEDIRNFVKHQTAPFKQPRKIEFVESLPKTTSGKIKRRLLRTRMNAASSPGFSKIVSRATARLSIGNTSPAGQIPLRLAIHRG